MLGSAFEADDAVQETLVRAWRAFEGFEGAPRCARGSIESRPNVCFDLLKGRNRRALPIDMMTVGSATGPVDPRFPSPRGSDRSPTL
jgi:RNA polymerase sigma-70 factor (ECF subfamily)